MKHSRWIAFATILLASCATRAPYTLSLDTRGCIQETAYTLKAMYINHVEAQTMGDIVARAVKRPRGDDNRAVASDELMMKIVSTSDPVLAAATFLEVEDKFDARNGVTGHLSPALECAKRINALLKASDVRAYYQPQAELLPKTWRGEASIGVELAKGMQEAARVVRVFHGQPAHRAGLQPGDLILTIDGESTKNLALSEVISRLQGTLASTVTLETIRPPSHEATKMQLVRERVRLPPNIVVMKIGSDGVYIRLRSFREESLYDVVDALLRRNVSGESPIRIVILDLRGNGGDRCILLPALQRCSCRMAQPSRK